MPRVRRTRRDRRPQLQEWELAWCLDEGEERCRAHGADDWDMFFLKYPSVRPESSGELWERAREVALPLWIRAHPGTRPTLWWFSEAPRWEDDPWPSWWYVHGTFAIPRERIGGTGTARHDCLGYSPDYTKGVPTYWLDRPTLAHYGSLTERPSGLPAEAFDPADPPLFESEAAYLRRLGLFVPGEEERLTDEDFRPTPVALPTDPTSTHED